MAQPVLESESVLNTIKRSLDIAADDHSFDGVIILHINSVLSDLYQLGLGTYGSTEHEISDENDEWETILGSQLNLSMIKSYISLRVRLLFDPPQTGFTTDSFQKQIDKMEWRIKTAAGSSPNTSEV